MGGIGMHDVKFTKNKYKVKSKTKQTKAKGTQNEIPSQCSQKGNY